jgi:hypothetical protein
MSEDSKAKKRLDPLKNFMPVSLMEAEPLIKDIFKARWVPNLVSSPGVGKSSIIRQIAENWNLCLIDIRLTSMVPEDLNGFPHTYEVEMADGTKTTMATYVPMDMWPIKGTKLPINPKTGESYRGWIVFLDELPAAIPAVQVAAYKLLLDRMIGLHRLDNRALVASAGNLMTDKAFANRQSTATQSRICTLPIKVCTESWHWWATQNNLDHRVQSFIKFQPQKLHDFDPDHKDLTFPCPRTWEMVSDIIKPMKDISPAKKPLLAGCIGVGAAREFFAYTQVFQQLPDFEQIIRDPDSVHLSSEPSVQYAVAGMIGTKMNESNADPCITFLGRLGADFQVTALRQAIAHTPALFNHKSVKEWRKFNTKALITRKA